MRALVLIIALVGIITPTPVSATWQSHFTEPITLSGDGVTEIELRAHLLACPAIAFEKPTFVTYGGVVTGYSLPVYDSDNEELFFMECVPNRWNRASNPRIHVHCYLPSANSGKNFNLSIDWSHFDPDSNDIIPSTTHTIYNQTATTGSDTYTSYEMEFAIDYDIDTPNLITADDDIHFRIYRTDATENEISGEVVITHVGIIWQRDRLGALIS